VIVRFIDIGGNDDQSLFKLPFHNLDTSGYSNIQLSQANFKSHKLCND